jgi:hypothetical protein
MASARVDRCATGLVMVYTTPQVPGLGRFHR